MKVMVLGSSGFVGQNVMSWMRGKYDLIAVSRREGIDITTSVFQVLVQETKPDWIVNCAAHVGSLNYVTERAAEVISDNTKIAHCLYDAVAQYSPKTKIINPLANCSYPAELEVYEEDKWMDGAIHRSVLSYGSSKRYLWALSECYKMQYGVRTISLLTPNMYGPYDSTDPNKAHALNALVSKFVKATYVQQPAVVIWGSGKPIREWIYAPDFGSIIDRIIQQDLSEVLVEPINIGQNYGLSITDIAELIVRRVGYLGQLTYDREKPDGAPKKVMGSSRFRRYFPDFEFTSMAAGLNETIEHYRALYPY